MTTGEIDRIIKAIRAQKKKRRCFMEVRFSPNKKAEILVAVDAAEVSLARSEGRVITQESMRQLAEDVKQRARNRLASVESKPR